MNTSDAFSRIWAAFEAGEILPACAWCGRVRIDETWVLPSRAALAAVDERYTFSHSICDVCAVPYVPAPDDSGSPRPARNRASAAPAR